MPTKSCTNALLAESQPQLSDQINQRKNVRSFELEKIIELLPAGAQILEVGAGAGWQARILSERGFDVQAIDIPESNYNQVRDWPVIPFDGVNIPFPQNSFDVVYSSNVQEHIPHIEDFQKEMQRVLRSDGIAIHVMPSAVWRFWTLMTFYPDRIKKAMTRILARVLKNKKESSESLAIQRHGSDKKRSFLSKVLTSALPPRHGEKGNVLSEIYLFSSMRWSKLLSTTGWRLVSVRPAGLFYSGQRLLGSSLSLSSREKLAAFLGSSCTIYILRKKNTSEKS